MIYDLIIRPQAEDDLAQACDWYERQRSGLGGDFILSFEAAIAEIRRRPASFSIVLKQTR
jgi:hypothetical protein